MPIGMKDWKLKGLVFPILKQILWKKARGVAHLETGQITLQIRRFGLMVTTPMVLIQIHQRNLYIHLAFQNTFL